VRRDHVGVDIGGTGIRATTDDPGVTTPVVRFPLDRTIRRDDLVALVAEAVSAATDPLPDSICVSVPAFVDARGEVTDCPSIPALTDSRWPPSYVRRPESHASVSSRISPRRPSASMRAASAGASTASCAWRSAPA
jgi:hypothetical protein